MLIYINRYEGQLCDQDMDPCKKGDLCRNKGECIYDTAFENNYSCKCMPGFMGKNCEADRGERKSWVVFLGSNLFRLDVFFIDWIFKLKQKMLR